MIAPPTQATLRRYGMTPGEWSGLLARQGRLCPVCRRSAHDVDMVIDHAHVKGWKALSHGERRRHVRGLVCRYCNHFRLGRHMTETVARSVAAYLAAHADRANGR